MYVYIYSADPMACYYINATSLCVYGDRALQMSLQMVLKFKEFREQVLVHATAHQAEQELADKVGQEIHVVAHLVQNSITEAHDYSN